MHDPDNLKEIGAMDPIRHSYAIRINPHDPARAAIAEDLTACGGTASADSELVYDFSTAGRRDEALRTVRGWAGTRSVEAIDQALRRTDVKPGRTSASAPPGPGQPGARSIPKSDQGGAPPVVKSPQGLFPFPVKIL